jgi:hypothetical protein
VKPLLLDEGLYPQVATALRKVEWPAVAVGQEAEGAPPRSSGDGGDAVNVRWCKDHSSVLVTNDRGKKDKKIGDLLAQDHVHAIFVHPDLRDGPPHRLLSALLASETKIDWHVDHNDLLRHRLRVGGGLTKR